MPEPSRTTSPTCFDQEFTNTLKVLRAVPDARRDYKPDERSRTAWELATHLVGTDLWFLDCVCDAVFVYDPEVEQQRTTGLATMDDVVAFYEREYPPRIQRLRSTRGEVLAKEVDAFGKKEPAISFLGAANSSPTSDRWAPRFRRSTAGAPTSPIIEPSPGRTGRRFRTDWDREKSPRAD